MSAWIYQDPKQVEKHGERAAAWSVGWYDPEGKRRCKSCGPGSEGKRNAEKLRKKIEAELLTGTYQSNIRKTWDQFRQEWDQKIGSKMPSQTKRLTLEALVHFERVVKPARIAAIKTHVIDEYIAKRREEKGRKDRKLSAASINKELRHLRAVLNIAKDWGYLTAAPKFRMLREPGKLVTYMPPEHFAAIYHACDQAKKPKNLPYESSDWWRGLLIMAYMTGWRIGELRALRREDVDLDKGEALTRAENNKGKRDELVRLHPLVVEHLRRLPGFEPVIFPWPYDTTTLYVEFRRLQKAAGVSPGRGKEFYGFHDLRRAFATLNAKRLTADALQALMRHKSYLTTKRYIDMANQLQDAIDVLFVPNVNQGQAQ